MNRFTKPQTNMEVCEILNQDNHNPGDGPYFNIEIHDYLIFKGAKFKQHSQFELSYQFIVNDEDFRLLFLTDIDQGQVKIQVWFEDDGDEHLLPERKWLTSESFTIPVGIKALDRFITILNAYIHNI